MHPDIQTHWDQILERYTDEPYRQDLLAAKEKYFKLTGTIYEEDDEYESRMNCFTDWYLTTYVPEAFASTIIKDYVIHQKLPAAVSEALLGVRHSIFIYHKNNSRQEIVLKDLMLGKKLICGNAPPMVGLLPADLFSGRVLHYQEKYYLLPGVCLFPKDVKSSLLKEAKRVAKVDERQKTHQFLLGLEALKTKWIRYGHLSSSKIFVF